MQLLVLIKTEISILQKTVITTPKSLGNTDLSFSPDVIAWK